MSKSPKPPVPLYSALADATRCKILMILQNGPIPVHKLADAFSISRPAISRHLRVLKTAGLVAEVKKGRENLYAFKPAKLERARAWIDFIAAPAGGASEDAQPVVTEAKPATAKAKPATATLKPVAATAKPRKATVTPARAPAVPAAETSVAAEPVAPAVATSISQMGFDF